MIRLERKSDGLPFVFESKDLINCVLRKQNDIIVIAGVQYVFSTLTEIGDGGESTVQNTVIGFRNHKPAEPEIGSRYIVGLEDNPTDSWNGIQNYIAEYLGEDLWNFTAPEESMSVRVQEELNENPDLANLEYVYKENVVTPSESWLHENAMQSSGVRDLTILPASLCIPVEDEYETGDIFYVNNEVFALLKASDADGMVNPVIKLVDGVPAWFDLTLTKGDTGNAVINSVTLAAFKLLEDLSVGDRYHISDENMIYEVLTIDVYGKALTAYSVAATIVTGLCIK